MKREPFPQTSARLIGQICKANTRTPQRIGPGDVACGFEIGRRFSQGKVHGEALVRFQWGQRLHGEAVFAEVEDHPAGNTVEAGESRRVDLVAQAMTPLR